MSVCTCVIPAEDRVIISPGAGGMVGWCGRWLVQGAVEVLFLVLEETVAQDGQDHYDTDGQQYSNSYLHGAWGKKGRMRCPEACLV